LAIGRADDDAAQATDPDFELDPGAPATP
jgi:hypothetical protein